MRLLLAPKPFKYLYCHYFRHPYMWYHIQWYHIMVLLHILYIYMYMVYIYDSLLTYILSWSKILIAFTIAVFILQVY